MSKFNEEKISDVLSVIKENNIVYLKGIIDETVNINKIFENFKGHIQLDFSDVININSCGVREWCHYVNALEGDIELVNCPSFIVEQASMIPEFLGKAKIKTFFADYYCENCNWEKIVLTSVTEIASYLKPVQDSFVVEWPGVNCGKCDAQMECSMEITNFRIMLLENFNQITDSLSISTNNQVFDLFMQSLVVVDKNFKILFYNKEFVRFLSFWRGSSLKNMSFEEVVEFPLIIKSIHKCFDVNRIERISNCKGKLLNESTVWINAVIFPIKADLDEIERVGIVIQDLTMEVNLHNHYKRQIKQLNQQHEELKVSYEKIKQIDEIKTNMLSIVSHELRTPIAVQGDTLEVFKDYFDDIKTEIKSLKKATKNLPEINSIILRLTDSVTFSENASLRMDRNVIKLSKLVNNILDLNQITKGKLYLQLEPINWNGLQNSIVEIFNNLMANCDNKQYLEFEFPDKSIIFKVDIFRLEQVFTNLIGNAVRYNKDKGIIKVGALKEENYFIFYVSDQGISIQEKYKKEIFNMFHSLGSSSHHTKKRGSLGLGLSICQGIVEAHGGKIWLESTKTDTKDQTGTKFLFSVDMLLSNTK